MILERKEGRFGGGRGRDYLGSLAKFVDSELKFGVIPRYGLFWYIHRGSLVQRLGASESGAFVCSFVVATTLFGGRPLLLHTVEGGRLLSSHGQGFGGSLPAPCSNLYD